MDVTNLLGSGVTIDLIKTSEVKEAIVLSGGAMAKMPDGQEKLSILVELNGRQLTWIPNKTSLKNVSEAHSVETANWVGKKISYEIGMVNGKEALIARPVVK